MCHLPTMPAGVARSFEQLREHDLGSGKREIVVFGWSGGRRIRGQAAAKRIAARQQGGSGWGAGCGRRIEVREAHAFGCHPIDVRRLEGWMSVTTEAAVSKIVSQNYDDVRGRRRGTNRDDRNDERKEGCDRGRAGGASAQNAR